MIWHMTGVLGYARTFYQGGVCGDEVRRFHLVLEDLGNLLERETPRHAISP